MLPEFHPQNPVVLFLVQLAETQPACAEQLCESLIDRMDEFNLLPEYTEYLLHNGTAPIRVGSLITDVLDCSYDLIRMNVPESVRQAERLQLIEQWQYGLAERRDLALHQLAA